MCSAKTLSCAPMCSHCSMCEELSSGATACKTRVPQRSSLLLVPCRTHGMDHARLLSSLLSPFWCSE